MEAGARCEWVLARGGVRWDVAGGYQYVARRRHVRGPRTDRVDPTGGGSSRILYRRSKAGTVRGVQYWDTRSRIGAIAALGGAALATLAVLDGGFVIRVGVALLACLVAFFALPGALPAGACPSCHAARKRQTVTAATPQIEATSVTAERHHLGGVLVRRGWKVTTPMSAECHACGVVHDWQETRFVPLSDAAGEAEALVLVAAELQRRSRTKRKTDSPEGLSV